MHSPSITVEFSVQHELDVSSFIYLLFLGFSIAVILGDTVSLDCYDPILASEDVDFYVNLQFINSVQANQIVVFKVKDNVLRWLRLNVCFVQFAQLYVFAWKRSNASIGNCFSYNVTASFFSGRVRIWIWVNAA